MLEPQKTQMEFMNEIFRQINKIKRSQFRRKADADWFGFLKYSNCNSHLNFLYLFVIFDSFAN